jgi:hypothetical protein
MRQAPRYHHAEAAPVAGACQPTCRCDPKVCRALCSDGRHTCTSTDGIPLQARRTLVLYALDLLVRLVMSRSSTFWMALLMRRTSAGSPAAAMLRSRMDALQRETPTDATSWAMALMMLWYPSTAGLVRQRVSAQAVDVQSAICNPLL